MERARKVTASRRQKAPALATRGTPGRDGPGPPVLCLVGRSGAGKTWLMVALVTDLKRRGYRVATIKHVGGHDFDIDHPEKDSWRYAQAGSDAVAVSSPHKLAIIRRTASDTSLEEILAALGPDFDLVLAEGYKVWPGDKVEVHRRELGSDLLCKAEELLAVVTDEPLDVPVPQYGFAATAALADFVEERLLGRRSSHVRAPKPSRESDPS